MDRSGGCTSGETQKKRKEMNVIKKELQEKDDYIAKLRQQISSQDVWTVQEGENSHDRSGSLSNLTTVNEQLILAQEQQQEYEMKVKSYKIEASYHQKHAEELQSSVKVSILVSIQCEFFISECMCKRSGPNSARQLALNVAHLARLT